MKLITNFWEIDHLINLTTQLSQRWTCIFPYGEIIWILRKAKLLVKVIWILFYCLFSITFFFYSYIFKTLLYSMSTDVRIDFKISNFWNFCETKKKFNWSDTDFNCRKYDFAKEILNESSDFLKNDLGFSVCRIYFGLNPRNVTQNNLSAQHKPNWAWACVTKFFFLTRKCFWDTKEIKRHFDFRSEKQVFWDFLLDK